MIKQIIEISQSSARLSVRYQQLIMRFCDGKELSRPIEDIGILLLDHPQISYTQAVLNELANNNCAVIICGKNHLPNALILPIAANTLQTERMRLQSQVKLPLKKQLWQTIIREKIKRQAKALEKLYQKDFTLRSLVKKVRSGDTANVEAWAARIYWSKLFGEGNFKRDYSGSDQNAALNYGYAILRAAIARSVCGAGLHPSIGIHHKNRYNPFCLADDLLEPFRPLVDVRVSLLIDNGEEVFPLNKSVKRHLLEILNLKVVVKEMQYPLMEGLRRMAASLYQSFKNSNNQLLIPKWSF